MEPCIQTYTGRKFWPLDPRPEDVCIEDIAHALSMKCRYTGHCKHFYSVAQHSVYVMLWLQSGACGPADLDELLWGLLYDAGEAYLPDIAGPIKRRFYVDYSTPFFNSFRWVENRILDCVAQSFGLPYPPFPTMVLQADQEILHAERHQIMAEGFPWGGLDGVRVADVTIYDWPPHTAEFNFLDCFHKLMGMRG